ncbi:MAG: DAK2 domain-containing protein, partial [Oscillospiraceae bacterium]
MREYLDAAAFRDIVLCANAALEQNKQIINELNVFPVPDGDTGTNMSLTMSAAALELTKKNPATLTGAADIAASALLRGARGNSGVILSLLFRGMAKKLKGHDTADARLFAAALSDGVDAAYKAVMKPAEGTILTVSRVATSSAIEFAENGSDLELMMSCAVESAREALADTINLNPVLARAGVVDAGGKGYLLILESALSVLQGKHFVAETSAPATQPLEQADFSNFDTGEIEFAYDTVFIVNRSDDKSLEDFRAYLNGIGDSLVIGEDDTCFKVHVHTNIPGAALAEAMKYGTLETAKIENMRSQHDELVRDAAAPSAPAPAEKKYGTVAVCAGDGMATLLREIGADRIVTGGQTMNPSTEDILNEINSTPAETVFVFPNNKNIIMAAEQCIPLAEKKVVVVPTKSVPQGVTALLSMDDSATVDELRDAMGEAIESIHTALVTYAARDSDFDGQSIHSGEFLSLLDGKLIGSYTNIKTLLEELSWAFDEFCPSIISIYYGEEVDEEDAKALASKLGDTFPDSEISVV